MSSWKPGEGISNLSEYRQLIKSVAAVVRQHCETHRTLNHRVEQVADKRTVSTALHSDASSTARCLEQNGKVGNAIAVDVVNQCNVDRDVHRTQPDVVQHCRGG